MAKRSDQPKWGENPKRPSRPPKSRAAKAPRHAQKNQQPDQELRDEDLPALLPLPEDDQPRREQAAPTLEQQLPPSPEDKPPNRENAAPRLVEQLPDERQDKPGEVAANTLEEKLDDLRQRLDALSEKLDNQQVDIDATDLADDLARQIKDEMELA